MKKIVPDDIEEYWNWDLIRKSIPRLHHKELYVIFPDLAFQSEEQVEQILALPRETLIEDLLKIIHNARKKTDEYMDGEYTELPAMFMTFALLLLGELAAEEALGEVLSLFGEDESILEFWLPSPEDRAQLWGEVIAPMAEKQTKLLEKFLCKEVPSPFTQRAAIHALSILYRSERISKDETGTAFGRVFKFYENDRPLPVTQMDVILSTMAKETACCRLVSLEPHLRKAEEDGYFDAYLIEEPKRVYEVLHSGKPPLKPVKRTFFERYELLTTFKETGDPDEFESET